MMITGPLLAWIQKLLVQHFTFEVEKLFTKVTIFTPVFRLLLVMLFTNLQIIVEVIRDICLLLRQRNWFISERRRFSAPLHPASCIKRITHERGCAHFAEIFAKFWENVLDSFSCFYIEIVYSIQTSLFVAPTRSIV